MGAVTGVILTGFMGTGKTTVGRLLAKRYGLPFMDMDDEIERVAGQSIPAIFEAAGEAGFRQLEREILQGLPPASVVATGGGALVAEGNRALLGNGHRVLCLACDATELAERLAGSGERPLLANWQDLLRERDSAYASFDQIDTTGRSPDEVAETIAQRLGLSRAGRLVFPGQRRSEVLFGRGLLDRAGSIVAGPGAEIFRSGKRASGFVVITDENVAGLGIADRAAGSLGGSSTPVHVEVLPAGEETKCLAGLDRLYGVCRRAGLDRAGVVVGVGGGVIGDLAGFLAATYMRGVRLVLYPTTLLAQVDAALGGKVGIDAQGVKNLVGAFYPARAVVVDPDVLTTLEDSRLSEGLAEMTKIAIMCSPALLAGLATLREPRDILCHPEMVRRAAEEKISVVEADPYERGERALLNFGHTIGHALEQASGYRVAHGAAVAAGMVAETRLGERLGLTEAGTADQVVNQLTRFNLPTIVPQLDLDFAFEAMLGDKKRQRGVLRFAIPERAGCGRLVPVSDVDARRALIEATGGNP
ncbi:MAG: 3-dehydroquinate synthase [Chloroflexota bacterium]|nr:3-dehydroquinate synthase [Chloroflexota bacterium]